MVEVSLTVGKLDASLALLLTKDHHLIEFPTILLPNGVKAGSIVKISCERDLETETEEQRQFLAVQDEILNTFGKNLPKAPLLKIKNVTQTSCVLEWEPLDLGTATLKSLTLFKDGKKLGAIPQPLNNRTTKLSGLPIEKSFKFQLKLDSTAGVYTSETVEVTTHKMTDLSGIQVCLGDITPNDQFTLEDIQQTLINMGAHHPASDKMKVETTHFVTTRENKQNPEFIKANDMNIPIIRPEWLKACEKERRIVGVRDFYVKDCVLPDLFAKNYWSKPVPAVPETSDKEKELPKAESPADESPADESPAAESQASSDSTGVPAVKVSAPSSDSQELETPKNAPKEGSVKKEESIEKQQAGDKEDKTEAAKPEDSTAVADETPKDTATGKFKPENVTKEAKSESKDTSSAAKPAAENTTDLGVGAKAESEVAISNAPVKNVEEKKVSVESKKEAAINEAEDVTEQKEAAILTEQKSEPKASKPDFPGEEKKDVKPAADVKPVAEEKVTAKPAAEKKDEKVLAVQPTDEEAKSGSLEEVRL